MLQAKKPKTLIMTDWPLYLWGIASVYMALTLWAMIQVQNHPGVWWRMVVAGAFGFILLVVLYIGKYEKLCLIAIEEDESFLIENRVLLIKTYNRFSVGHIVSIKVKESGKSSKCYTIEINLVDGRQFSIFASGIKEKSLRKQFIMRRFIEEYFELKHPKS